MDPSHAKKYKRSEIEGIVDALLGEGYPDGICVPIDIDVLAQQHPRVDDIVPAELEERFNVAAVLLYKPTCRRFDIFFDENTPRGRTSFSIAHEFAHVVLHGEVCTVCETLDAAIELRTRLQRRYTQMEIDADYFARSILMPRNRVLQDTAQLYEGLFKLYGCDPMLIQTKLCPHMARQYGVSNRAMEIRLELLGLRKAVAEALQHKFSTIDI
ncbi:ImmA/IrrE family metallo-endopeptidase [Anaerobaca lacustris]|uniref:ImmA/IrrE family metallo-endopeptidase n=1 Tax=Anaerobaca lacustris TaxID=3044600 RepID=A0AAW6TT66_9BACT|nr:ImmA/IrrE family metallo-endopeptidase [Sedimentisphaerales bacterium M17dextr]